MVELTGKIVGHLLDDSVTLTAVEKWKMENGAYTLSGIERAMAGDYSGVNKTLAAVLILRRRAMRASRFYVTLSGDAGNGYKTATRLRRAGWLDAREVGKLGLEIFLTHKGLTALDWIEQKWQAHTHTRLLRGSA